VLTPDEAVDAAQTQWDALPDDVREALGVGDGDGGPWGDVAENWSIEASVDLSGEAEPGVLGSLVTSRCHAVVDALVDTDVVAYGTFPLASGLVAADHATCTPVDPAAFDAALAAASTPLPLAPVLENAPWTTSVIAVPAGTAMSAVARCRDSGAGESVSVESPDHWGLVSRISWSGATVDPEDAGPTRADCGAAPATGALLPTLRFTPTGGVPTDVVVLDVTDPFPGTAPALRVAVG
jgi:hypothetical protein